MQSVTKVLFGPVFHIPQSTNDLSLLKFHKLHNEGFNTFGDTRIAKTMAEWVPSCGVNNSRNIQLKLGLLLDLRLN